MGPGDVTLGHSFTRGVQYCVGESCSITITLKLCDLTQHPFIWLFIQVKHLDWAQLDSSSGQDGAGSADLGRVPMVSQLSEAGSHVEGSKTNKNRICKTVEAAAQKADMPSFPFHSVAQRKSRGHLRFEG